MKQNLKTNNTELYFRRGFKKNEINKDNISESYLSGEIFIRGDATNIRGEISNISGDVSNISGDVSNISGNVTKLSGDVSPISGEVSNLSGWVDIMGGDVSKIYGEISSKFFMGDVTGLSGNITGINREGLFSKSINVVGDLDSCEITPEDRKKGVNIDHLIGN